MNDPGRPDWAKWKGQNLGELGSGLCIPDWTEKECLKMRKRLKYLPEKNRDLSEHQGEVKAP